MGLLNYTTAAMLSGAGQAGTAALASQQQFNQQSDLEAQRAQADINKAQVIQALQTQENVRHEQAEPGIAGATTAATGAANLANANTTRTQMAQNIAQLQGPLDQQTTLVNINASRAKAGTPPVASLDDPSVTPDERAAAAPRADQFLENYGAAAVKAGYVDGSKVIDNNTKDARVAMMGQVAAIRAQSATDIAETKAQMTQFVALLHNGNQDASQNRLMAMGYMTEMRGAIKDSNDAIKNAQAVTNAPGADPASPEVIAAKQTIKDETTRRGLFYDNLSATAKAAGLPVSAAAPAGDAPPPTAGTVATPKTQADLNALPAGAQYINPSDGKRYVKKAPAATPAASTPAAKPDPFAGAVSLPPGAPNPNDAIQAQRSANSTAALLAKQQQDGADAEAARQARIKARQQDAARAGILNSYAGNRQ